MGREWERRGGRREGERFVGRKEMVDWWVLEGGLSGFFWRGREGGREMGALCWILAGEGKSARKRGRSNFVDSRGEKVSFFFF